MNCGLARKEKRLAREILAFDSGAVLKQAVCALNLCTMFAYGNRPSVSR